MMQAGTYIKACALQYCASARFYERLELYRGTCCPRYFKDKSALPIFKACAAVRKAQAAKAARVSEAARDKALQRVAARTEKKGTRQVCLLPSLSGEYIFQWPLVKISDSLNSGLVSASSVPILTFYRV